MTFCCCAQEVFVNLLNKPGERGHLFWLQMSSVMVNTGATQQLGALKNFCARHIMSNPETLTAEIESKK